MKTCSILFFILILLLTIVSAPTEALSQTRSWKSISSSIPENQFRSIYLVNTHPEIIFLISSQHIYKTESHGKEWKHIFDLPLSPDIKINQLLSSPYDSNRIYITTSEGLYISKDLGTRFKLSFTSLNEKEKNCFAIAFDPNKKNTIYLGTEAGLFTSENLGEDWKKNNLSLTNELIKKIIPLNNGIASFIIMTDKGLYHYNQQNESFKTLFKSNSFSREEAVDEEIFLSNLIEDVALIDKNILLATRQGLLISNDEGLTWSSFPSFGLQSQEIKAIVSVTPDLIFASTSSGVYQYTNQKKRWELLNLGLHENETTDLVYHPLDNGSLFTVTPTGAFTLSHMNPVYSPEIRIQSPFNMQQNKLNEYLQKEPSIQNIQEASVLYSDLSDQKIKRWHQQSRLKHLLPTLSGGIDQNASKNVNLDRGSTNQPDVFILGPDEKSWGWDINVSWDLSDFIWSSSQTSIDSRSKLMVDLRNEILTNLTRIYFERRRLIADFFLKETQNPIELSLKLEELTALIDAYTGGYLSNHLAEKKITPPWKE